VKTYFFESGHIASADVITPYSSCLTEKILRVKFTICSECSHWQLESSLIVIYDSMLFFVAG
jgi:hypothetical protein